MTNQKKSQISHDTIFHLTLKILFPVNAYVFLLECGFASQCVSSAKKNNLPSFTQRDLKMRSQSRTGSIQPPSSPCQQGVYSANSHTSSWAVAARPAAMLRIKQFLSKHVFSGTCTFFYGIRLHIMTSFQLITDRFICTLFMLIWKDNLACKSRMWQ